MLEPVSVNLLGETSWRARSFHALKRFSNLPLRGAWRARKLGKRLVGSRYLQIDHGRSRVYVCPSHLSGLQLLANEHPERMLFDLTRHYAEHGASFVDIGANIGLATIEAATSIQPDQQVIAFEPEPRMFEVLRANCELNELEAELCPFALGRDEGAAEFFVSTTGNQGNHSLISRPGTSAAESCRVATLDRVFEQRDFQPPLVLLKIDTEGAEPWVLSGGRRWLSQRDELAILCEISTENLERAGSSLAEVERVFDEAGITSVFFLDETGRQLKRIESVGSVADSWYNVLATKGRESEGIAEAFARALDCCAQSPSSAT